jgi:biofilm PGA synthesis N-glycosyltransferase PgaC
MSVILIILVGTLVAFFLLLHVLWEKIPKSEVLNLHEGVTVLIPVRNEEANIYHLLDRLNRQRFPMQLLEVLVIDDHSDDLTLKEVRRAAKHARYSLKTIRLDHDQNGKKIASTVGNEHAKHELILCTDADTVPSDDWISSMTGPLAKLNLQMVSGPVHMRSKSFFGALQSMEFLGLIGFGAATLDEGIPTMCNGANMAYQKAAFQEVGGYLDNLHIPSGDDEFLLRKITQSYPGSTAFVKSPEAIVETQPKLTLSSFWSQRVRWLSKWRYHKSPFINMLATFSLLVFGGLSIYLTLTVWFRPLLYVVAISLATFSNWLYLKGLNDFFNSRYSAWKGVLLVIIYPYYVVVLGIASIFGSYSWKGRKY